MNRGNLKALLLAAIAPLALNAGGLELAIPFHAIAHPVKAYHSVPAGKRFLALADILLEDANFVDYATTRRGAFPGTGGCELNPLLTTAPCQIDVPRFTGVKIGVAAVGAAEWIPVLKGWGGEKYIRIMTILDFAGLAPLAVIDAHNVGQLTK